MDTGQKRGKTIRNHDRFGQCRFDRSTIAVAVLRCPATHCTTDKMNFDAIDFWSKNGPKCIRMDICMHKYMYVWSKFSSIQLKIDCTNFSMNVADSLLFAVFNA